MGLSHRSAPIAVLEDTAQDSAGVVALLDDLATSEALAEVLVLATCNRLEVYAEAVTFHGAVAAIGQALDDAVRCDPDVLREHLYVHYDDRAIAHTFSVAAGLDSMAVGETQILTQLRDALAVGQGTGAVGESLNALFQRALRVGKAAHTDTHLDRRTRSLVDAALDEAVSYAGPLSERAVAVVGAGSMSALASAAVVRGGAASLTVVNRTAEAGRRVAQANGSTYRSFAELADVIAGCDIVISCTGALDHVITADLMGPLPAPRRGPRVLVDLAMPRDVAPDVAGIDGVVVLTLHEIGRVLRAADTHGADDLREVEDLITGSVADYLAGRAAKSAVPTVTALRARAADVVASELARFDTKNRQLDPAVRAEVEQTVRRVVDKLLHAPTVRVKELSTEGIAYAEALRELFDLDPHEIAAVSVPIRLSERGPS